VIANFSGDSDARKTGFLGLAALAVGAVGVVLGWPMKRVRYPRILRTEVEDLARAHEDVCGVIMSLNDAKWAGAIPSILALQRVDKIIAVLVNRAEPAYLASGRPKSISIPQDRSQEITPAEHIGSTLIASPGDAPELPRARADRPLG